MSYNETAKGWNKLYLGLLSPYRNKYKKYVELGLLKA
jgi:hypothetical protein